MQRRQFMAAALPAPTFVLGIIATPAWALSDADAASGLRVALERGAVAAVGLLGRTDGFMGNPQVRIPLPGNLKELAKLLSATGQQRKVDELVLAINRAAEAAVPEARDLLLRAAKALTPQDALRIVKGGDTSVTDYFSTHTREPLTEKFLPIVTRATQKVALAQKFNAVAAKGAQLGLVNAQESNIQRYVTIKSLDGLYLMIGEEERRIRRDPVGTGSAILKKVFGF